MTCLIENYKFGRCLVYRYRGFVGRLSFVTFKSANFSWLIQKGSL